MPECPSCAEFPWATTPCTCQTWCGHADCGAQRTGIRWWPKLAWWLIRGGPRAWRAEIRHAWWWATRTGGFCHVHDCQPIRLLRRHRRCCAQQYEIGRPIIDAIRRGDFDARP